MPMYLHMHLIPHPSTHAHTRIYVDTHTFLHPNARITHRWWDTIWEAQLNDGEKVFSLTPEYGPAPYTPSAPITSPHSTYNPITLKEPAPTSPAVSVSAPAVSRLSEQAGRGSVPVTSVWDIVNQQADRQRDRFEAWRARVAPSSAERSLPMIDISPFTRTAPCPTSASLEELEEHQQQKLECAKEMFHACKEVGFFYLTGHGVDDALYKGVNDQAAAFFQQDQAIKDRCLITNSQFPEAGRGYQRLAQNVTQEQRDWHEGFDFYRQLEDDHPLLQRLETLGEEERKRQTPMLRAKNVMPNYPPTFTPLLHRYVQEMNHLGSCVMRAIALGLELDEDHFTSQYIDDPFWVMRVINYPPLPSAALARLEGSCGDSKHSADSDMDVGVSCGEHSDYGCLTIVNQDEVTVKSLCSDSVCMCLDNSPPIMSGSSTCYPHACMINIILSSGLSLPSLSDHHATPRTHRSFFYS